jgi:nucleoside-diphosphate-sugar epimerase
MKYFVTGGTGFVGGALVRQLRAAGHTVNALVRDPTRAARLDRLGATLFAGDVADRPSLLPAMVGVDGVFHVAGWYKLDSNNRAEAWRVNVLGTCNVLNSMRDLGIKKGVYTSTLAVNSDTHGRMVDESYKFDGPHLTIYDHSKWVAHYEVALPLMKDGLPLTTVLPGLIYGPGDASQIHDTWVRLLTGRLKAVPKRTAYCWSHVDDVAAGHILAMEKGKPGESYIIAGPPYTLIEALEMAARLTGSKLPRLKPGPTTMRATAALAALLERFVPIPPGYRSGVVRSTAGVTYLGSNAKARKELGYNPRSLDEGLPETLAWERSQLASGQPPATS